MSLDVAQVGVRTEASRLVLRHGFLTLVVLLVTVAFALVPAVIGALALFGVLR